MLSLRFLGLALLSTSPLALATDLDITVQSNGVSSVAVAPGALVPYTVTIELGDALTAGLGGFAFDLVFDGGDLGAAVAPATGPTLAFRSPVGISNPAGFGGTLIDGKLVQVGGAQNTIQNFFAPVPSGAVTFGVAQPGSAVLVLTGTVQAPTEGGSFTLSVENALANGIVAGQSGFPFYSVDALDVTTTGLVIDIASTLARDVAQVPLSSGGTQALALDAGAINAGRIYLVLGSMSGTLPGITANGITLPLNADPYLNYTLVAPNVGPLFTSFGMLDGQGQAASAFTLPAGVSPLLAGMTLHHAYVLVTPTLDFASNSVSVTLIP